MAIDLKLLSDIRTNIGYVSLIVLCVIGVLGNALSFFIYTRAKFRVHSTNVYLACLAIFDTLRLLSVWVHRSPAFLASDTVICRVFTLINTFLFQYCNWIPVLTSLDRLIAIRYPFYFNMTKKLSFQLTTLFGLMTFIVGCNAHIPVVYDVVKRPNVSDTCTISPRYTSILDTKTISLFNLILMPNILPFIFMTIFTTIFTFYLFRSKAKLKKSNDKEVKFAKTLIGLNVYFLICNLPFGIAHFFVVYFKYGSTDTAILQFITSIFGVLSQGHNAFGFLVYLICNKLYRDECLIYLPVKFFKSNNENTKYEAKSATKTSRVPDRA